MREATGVVVARHEAFRAVCLALCYPGRPFALPAAGASTREELLVEAVWGEETRTCHASGSVPPSGVPPEQAALLIVEGTDSSRLLGRLPRGSEEAPEGGATAVYLATGPGAGTPAVLRGPGVDGHLRSRLPISRGDLADRADACEAAPMGVDLLLVRHGTVIGLPRTTRLTMED